MLLDKLSKLVESNDLSQAEFECVAYKLSSAQARLFTHLSENVQSDTITIRNQESIGNISDVARRLNLKLAANDDPRQVICLLKPNTNKFDESGFIGFWSLVNGAANESA